MLPKGHPLAGSPLSLAQLAGEAFILYPANPRPSYADHVLVSRSRYLVDIGDMPPERAAPVPRSTLSATLPNTDA